MILSLFLPTGKTSSCPIARKSPKICSEVKVNGPRVIAYNTSSDTKFRINIQGNCSEMNGYTLKWRQGYLEECYFPKGVRMGSLSYSDNKSNSLNITELNQGGLELTFRGGGMIMTDMLNISLNLQIPCRQLIGETCGVHQHCPQDNCRQIRVLNSELTQVHKLSINLTQNTAILNDLEDKGANITNSNITGIPQSNLNITDPPSSGGNNWPRDAPKFDENKGPGIINDEGYGQYEYEPLNMEEIVFILCLFVIIGIALYYCKGCDYNMQEADLYNMENHHNTHMQNLPSANQVEMDTVRVTTAYAALS